MIIVLLFRVPLLIESDFQAYLEINMISIGFLSVLIGTEKDRSLL